MVRKGEKHIDVAVVEQQLDAELRDTIEE